MTNRAKITMAGARAFGRTRGHAVGQRRAGSRTAGATERRNRGHASRLVELGAGVPGAGRRARLPRAREGRRESGAPSRFRPDTDEARCRVRRAALAVVEAVHGESDAELSQKCHPARARPSARRLGRARRHRPLLPRIRTQKAGRRESKSWDTAQQVRLRHRVGPSARRRRKAQPGTRARASSATGDRRAGGCSARTIWRGSARSCACAKARTRFASRRCTCSC